MEIKKMNGKSCKPFVIANPIYDTVFKRLMENHRIVKFFLSTILEQQVEDVAVLPQEFTYKIDSSKFSDRDKRNIVDNEKKGEVQYYTIFRLDFIATVLTNDGIRRKILIELQKTWDTADVIRFRKYLGEQYIRVETINGKETTLPTTTIYILGNNLDEIDCPCIKVGRIYIDMLNKTAINAKSEFIEHLTHDSYVIQAGRITDVRYTTNLDKLLSIFEQRYFTVQGSEVRKEYPYQPDDENMELITDVLYEMGSDPIKRKEIEDEEEALRTLINMQKKQTEPLKKTIEEQAKEITGLKGENTDLKGKITDLKGEITDLREKFAGMESLLRDILRGKQIE
jgi:hypothetical protein